jgi:PAS domain S-box-containing protein
MTFTIDAVALLQELSDGVFVCSKEGEILYSNPALARILGVSSRAIGEMNLAKDFVDRKLEWQALVSLLEQGGIIQDYELRLKRKDGSIVHSSLTVSNLRDEAGALIGLAGILRDITTRKGVEFELREKAFRIDIMNKIAKMASSETDIRKHALVSMAEELRKLVNFDILLIGVTEDNGRHVQVIAPATDQRNETKTLGTVPFEGSTVEKLKFGRKAVVIDKDAGKKQFSELALVDAKRMESMLCVALTSRGRVIGSLDIASTRPGEYGVESVDTLQMVADQIAGLMDNLSLLNSLQTKISLQDVLVKTGVELQKAIDTQQIYAAISHGMKEIVDYSDLSFYLVDWPKRLIYPVYAIGHWANEVMAAPGSIDEGLVGAVAKTGKAEFTDDIDADPRSADIPGVPLEHNSMLALPLTVGEGVIGVLEVYRPRGQVFTIGDFEAAKLFVQQASIALANAQLFTKLQEAKREIEMLNDLMFHDINNFNFATLNYLQMMASDDLGPEQKSHLEKSLKLIRQTAELIDNVKKLTKIGVINSSDFVRVDLSRVLAKASLSLENSFPGRSVSVKVDVPASSFVMANNLLEELFINLLSNSVKYDPHQQAEIDISCRRITEDSRPMWKICVEDRGTGVPDDKKSLLFQKHVRLKPDSGVSGAGLGLSICQALTDKFGGRIWVEDRVPGQSELGARFCVVLPSAPQSL